MQQIVLRSAALNNNRECSKLSFGMLKSIIENAAIKMGMQQ